MERFVVADATHSTGSEFAVDGGAATGSRLTWRPRSE
jgi:hypothetical protein